MSMTSEKELNRVSRASSICASPRGCGTARNRRPVAYTLGKQPRRFFLAPGRPSEIIISLRAHRWWMD